MTEPTLHPNLASLASSYDEILRELAAGRINTAQARSAIAQLQARDDQGIRWSIDPDTGAWVRVTALGDLEFDDSPPTSGYRTADAFDFGAHPAAFNPNDQVHLTSADPGLNRPPTALAGATRKVKPVGLPGAPTSLPPQVRKVLEAVVAAPAALMALPTRTRNIAIGVGVLLLVTVTYSCSTGDTPAPAVSTPVVTAPPVVKPAYCAPLAVAMKARPLVDKSATAAAKAQFAKLLTPAAKAATAGKKPAVAAVLTTIATMNAHPASITGPQAAAAAAAIAKVNPVVVKDCGITLTR